MIDWRHLRRDPDFQDGLREMGGLAPGIGAWALVTGVAMAKSGLSVPLCLLMSLTVFAGSAQLASLPLLAAGAPLWVVWATAACVNLRFVIFSAGWRPYFGHLPRAQRMLVGYLCGDLNYVCFMRRYPQPQPKAGQLSYFLAGAGVNWVTWQTCSVVGILAADRIPTAWGLGFAGTLALIGLTLSLLVDRATWIAAAVAALAAVAAYGLPLKLNIVVSILAAVAAGVLLDHWQAASTPKSAASGSR